MSIRTYSAAPYYDDYDESKDYVQVVATAGNYAQAREFTQIGTMYRDFLARLGDAIFSDGQIISGCELYVTADKKKAVVNPGSIYLDGLVRNIRTALSVNITGVGDETIGFKVVESLVTAESDVSLRNPAVGTEGYNSEGAARVKQVVVLTHNDTSAVSVYRLVDGTLNVTNTVVNDNTETLIENQLAKRTYDTSGNFKIEGLNIQNKETADDVSQVYVGAGRAYVYGHEVVLQNMLSVDCEIPKSTRDCIDEPHYIDTINDKVTFNNNPLKTVNRVVTNVRRTFEITRGSKQGGRDFIIDGLAHIEKVVYNGKTYVSGTDYQQIGNYIDWSPISETQEPPTGSTYQVTFIYKHQNEVSKDYNVKGSGMNMYIQFVPTSDNRPLIEGVYNEVLIDYTFYLYRVDTYCIDQNGAIKVLKGNPDSKEYVEAPINNDDTTLTLGTVLNIANTNQKVITNTYSIRLTQGDIYNLKRRIDDLEYDQAVTDLDKEAKEGEDATELKGIFTDGFIGFSKADITNPEWNAAIDVDAQELTVPSTQNVVKLDISKSESSISQLGSIVSAPYENVVALAQPKATGKFLVNPYAVFGKKALMWLTPAVDNWIDDKTVTVENSKASASVLRRWWYHRGEAWAASEKQKWLQLTGTTGEQLQWANYNGVSTSVVNSVKDTVVTYMRSITVQFSAANFEPSEDGIELYFNDNKLTPASMSIEGTTSGTLKADTNGRVSGSFVIPGGTPCGTVEVRLQGPITTATASFTSNGTIRTTTTTITRTKVEVKTQDPLAQTFQFDKDIVLTGIDLFFAAKDSKRGVTVQIRNVVNGYPGNICYEEDFLLPENINVNGDKPVATKVWFNQPVYCKADTQYCFVVLSDSKVYQMWCAEMGQMDVNTKQMLNYQPYIDGVMFSSSNGLTWTAEQTKDITFTLYKARYIGTGTIVFNSVSKGTFDRVLLAAETEDHKNAGIEWWYRINGTSDWSTIETYADRSLTSAGTRFDLKAVVHVAQSTSPMLAGDCINLVYFVNGNSCTYVSREIEMSEAYTSIKVDVQICLPDGCTHHIYYSIDGGSWVELTSPTVTDVDAEFSRYVYEKTGISGHRYRVKMVMKTADPLKRPRARKLMNILRY